MSTVYKKNLMPLIFPVASHTDNVGPGSTFVAIKGQHYDGILYIPQAIARGANKVVIQEDAVISKDIIRLLCDHGISLIHVANPRKALAQLSAQAAGFPSRQLKILGVTGTKGKTTSVYILEALLKQLGKKVARLSTVANAINGDEVPALLTTSQPDYLHQFFALCVQQEVEYVVMEIAAQAKTFSRLETIELDGFIFTNLDREHAELYPKMEDYFYAKKNILNALKAGCPAIVNGDDAYGRRILAEIKQGIGFSSHLVPDAHSVLFKYTPHAVQLIFANKELVCSYKGLPGIFNGYNLAGVLILLDKLGFDIATLCEKPLLMPKVPGRLEEYSLPNGASAYIDYAHTPGSFSNILSVVRQWTDMLIVVFGAGGGKDPIKRPLMGSIAAQYADVVIITTDNSRQEDPQKIVSDILKGIENKDKVIIELDRKKAIENAYQYSKKGSIIMLLGKGPDEYQIIGNTKIPFSEKAILQSFLK